MLNLQAYLDREVPITRAMGVSVSRYDERGVVLDAPLAPNLNDKGTAFGGSQGALLSLAAWAVTRYALDESGVPGDIVIVHSELRYLCPARHNFRACCDMPDGEAVGAFQRALKEAGRARWTLQARIECGDEIATVLSGSYHGWRV